LGLAAEMIIQFSSRAGSTNVSSSARRVMLNVVVSH
jgi:hypothetical protein